MIDWYKKDLNFHPWFPTSWIGELIEDITKTKDLSGQLIAIQGERQSGKTSALIALLGEMVTDGTKRKTFLVITPDDKGRTAIRDRIMEAFPCNTAKRTYIQLEDSKTKIIFLNANFLVSTKKDTLLRGLSIDTVFIDNADMMQSSVLHEIVRDLLLLFKVKMVLFGSNIEDKKGKKSAWLYYLNSPNTIVYSVKGICDDTIKFPEFTEEEERIKLFQHGLKL